MKKNSIVLIELLFSIVLFSIIGFMVVDITYNIYLKNKTETNTIYSNMLLETTRLFLLKNNHLNLLNLVDDKLYYDNNLLLDKVSSYTISLDDISTINICIEDNTYCQQWKISNEN